MPLGPAVCDTGRPRPVDAHTVNRELAYITISREMKKGLGGERFAVAFSLPANPPEYAALRVSEARGTTLEAGPGPKEAVARR